MRPQFSTAPAWNRQDVIWLAALTVLALALRWPYWQSIPPEGDEPAQLLYALKIAQGEILPLTGNDAYTGPFFVYLLAGLFRLGVDEPLLGRLILNLSSALTVPATYLWLRSLPEGRLASVVAAGLVAVNPHLILLGHRGGATFLVPFFITVFLWLLTTAVARDDPLWWLAAMVAAGLALQANPMAVLPVAGGWLWFTARQWQAKKSSVAPSRLSRRWPLWPLVGGLCLLLVYSPVLIHNLTTATTSVAVAGERSYLWENSPSLPVYADNLRRLGLQIVRQMSGVLVTYEVFADIAGLPLLYLAWLLAGLWAARGWTRVLLLLTVLPHLLLVPYLSAHYGDLLPVRFTSYLTPILAGAMGIAVSRASDWLRLRFFGNLRRVWLGLASVSVTVLLLWPLYPLAGYYRSVAASPGDGQLLLDVSQALVSANRGEPVYIGFSENFMLAVSGVPYVPQVYLALAGIPQEFIPVEQIIGRVFERPEPTMFLLLESDAERLRSVAALQRLPGSANERAASLGYGLYVLNTPVALSKPTFVLTGQAAQDIGPQHRSSVRVGEALELLGYDSPEQLSPGAMLELSLYWQAQATLPPGRYMGFVHLFDPTGTTLIAQSDHELGQTLYPVGAWRPEEVVIDQHRLAIPIDAEPGRYLLRTGVYAWPSQQRLSVPTHPDNLIQLLPVEIRPPE